MPALCFADDALTLQLYVQPQARHTKWQGLYGDAIKGCDSSAACGEQSQSGALSLVSRGILR